MIRVRDLSKRYPSGTVGLDGVRLEVGAGEFVALIGSSGAGKSTLLRCLNGLVTPTGGAVKIDGLPVTGASRPNTISASDWDVPSRECDGWPGRRVAHHNHAGRWLWPDPQVPLPPRSAGPDVAS